MVMRNPVIKTIGAIGAGIGLLSAAFAAPSLPAAITTDPPRDMLHPARMEVVHIPQGGTIMNGVLWLPQGAGPHKVAIIYHGLPGNEQNMDLAQTLRRAGWAVLTFHYRGSWGSGGQFSFQHAFEDSQVALDFVRSHAGAYGLDASRIVVIGHSMGGMAAGLVGAHNPGLLGTVLISAADFGRFPSMPGGEAALARSMADNRETLVGTSPHAMAAEIVAHADAWELLHDARALSVRPLLVVTADDGLAPVNEELAHAVNDARPHDATLVHLTTDHGYSDQRISLQVVILDWLDKLTPAPVTR